MKKLIRNIQARPSPQDSRQMQVTYEAGDSRRIHHLPADQKRRGEPDPHGAGSFHDPEHHYQLMDRVEAMLRRQD